MHKAALDLEITRDMNYRD